MAMSDMSPEDKQTLMEHLKALRRSLVISVLAILAAAMVCFAFNEPILAFIIKPLLVMDENLIVTGVTEAFFVKLKLSLLGGLVIALPIVLWSLWGFFKPALYPHERKYVYILLPIMLILFAGGVSFAFFLIMKLILNFFIFIVGDTLETMFKVDEYVAFVMSMCIPFGLVFELPVVVFFLSKLGIVRHALLARNRKYALLIIVVLSAALTPGGDPFSQLLMAGPVYLLYEISIIVAKLAKPSPERLEQVEAKRAAKAARKEARRAARAARRVQR